MANPWFSLQAGLPGHLEDLFRELSIAWQELWAGKHHASATYQQVWQDYRRSLRVIEEKLQQGQLTAAIPLPPDVLGNKIFRQSIWSKSHYFAGLKWQYAAYCYLTRQLIATSQLTGNLQEKLSFFLGLHLAASAPCNYLAGNPDALKLGFASSGISWQKGWENWLSDLAQGRITQSDPNAFKVGENIAITPGDVIFRNELIELLEYSAQTEAVYRTPLLIVPPCINKYYILDLRPGNSLIRYLVQQGFRVFLISWRNPKFSEAHWGWFDYLEQGIWQACHVIQKILPDQDIHTMGFCIGGLLLSSALTAQHSTNTTHPRVPVKSCTLITTLLDYYNPGPLKAYLPILSTHPTNSEASNNNFLLTAQQLHATFASLRPQTLIWPFVIQNYLQGKKPLPLDFLHWNGDGTNLPGKFYSEYLTHCYLTNQWKEPGQIRLNGYFFNLQQLKVPTYLLATENDHIVPWQSAYASTQLIGASQPLFTLASGGHIAGVISPPDERSEHSPKCYWTYDKTPQTAQEWYDHRTEHAGSWWAHWVNWLRPLSGNLVKAPLHKGNTQYSPLMNAPGKYVLENACTEILPHTIGDV